MLRITPLPAFADNYIWVLENAGETWVVDPGDAQPVEAFLAARQASLTGILITHHHRDHVGGVSQLARPGMRVVGPARERLPQTTEALVGGEQVTLAGLQLQVMALPGHTLNHLAYFGTAVGSAPFLFCGDTLFVAGCGRLFEGTPDQMFDSLGKLSRLPDNTHIYCAHEYTLANLRFALQVDPGNDALPQSLAEARELRASEQPTVPSTLAREKRTNPFLRTHLQPIKHQVSRYLGREIGSDLDCFAALRQWKDHF